MGAWMGGCGKVLLVALASLSVGFYGGVAAQHRGPAPPPYSGLPYNITVYHVNEGSYGAAPINMNTADLNGDMFFDLRSKPLAMECAPGRPPSGHDCTNQEVNPPADDPLVVTKLVLTIAAAFGPYGRCNVCVNGTDGHGDNNCKDNAYICNCGGGGGSSKCPANVGFENVSTHFAGRRCNTGSPNYMCWKDATAGKVTTPTGGVWYSTTDEGYGTTWKVATVVKRVSKACSDEAINAAVERAGSASGCFQRCGPHSTGPGRNTSDACWITCFEETVLGPD